MPPGITPCRPCRAAMNFAKTSLSSLGKAVYLPINTEGADYDPSPITVRNTRIGLIVVFLAVIAFAFIG